MNAPKHDSPKHEPERKQEPKHTEHPVVIPAGEAQRLKPRHTDESEGRHAPPLAPVAKPGVVPESTFQAETTVAPPGEPAFPAETTDDGTLKGVDTPVVPEPKLPVIRKYQPHPATVEVVEFNGQNAEECKLFCPQIANEADGCLSIPVPKERPLAGHVRVGDYIVKPTGSDAYYVVTRDELKGGYKKLP
jgi:hypothetical protein